jgi:hypothetical protein
MSRTAKLTAAALAVAAAVPAVSGAAHNDLRGAPQMHRVDAQTVQVAFVTDKRLGSDTVRVAVSDAGAARGAAPDGRHGNDFKYIARVRVDRELRVGRTYTVRLKLGDDDAQVRQVVLRAR